MKADINQAAALEHHHAHYFNKIRYGVKSGDPLRPYRHTFNGSVQAAKQVKYHGNEKRYQHRLLLCLRVGGEQQTKAQNGGEINGRENINGEIAPQGYYAIHEPCYSQTDSEYADGQHPERDELA